MLVYIFLSSEDSFMYNDTIMNQISLTVVCTGMYPVYIYFDDNTAIMIWYCDESVGLIY